jgi:acyl-CoA hydrolase
VSTGAPDPGVVDALARLLRPGMRVVVADGAGAPAALLAALPQAAERSGPVDLLLGWCLEPPAGLTSPGFSSVTGFVASDGVGPAIGAGEVDYVPVRLSSLTALLTGPWKPDLLLASAARIEEGIVLGSEAAWIPTALEVAGAVAVEVDRSLPAATDLPPLRDGRFEVVAEVDRGPVAVGRPRLTDEDREVGRLVAGLLPEGAHIQFGPGAIGEAVLAALERPVSVWSGVLTDAVVELDTRGLLERAVGSYAIGTEALWDWAARRRPLRRLEETHDPARLRELPFVAINTALTVDRRGQVGVESVGGRMLGAVGGHPDFALAASVAPTGLSIVALPTSRRGNRTLVDSLAEPVTTARYDIDVIVTERGAVDLRGIAEAERQARIESIWASGQPV